MEEQQKPTIKVEYKKARLFPRLLSFFVDAFFYISLTVLMFGISHSLMPQLPAYAEIVAKREAIQEASGLYVDGADIATYAVSPLSPYTTTITQKDYLSEKLGEFYDKAVYCPKEARGEYDVRRAEAKNGSGIALFELIDGKLVERNLNPQDFLDFYTKEVRQYSLSYLSLNTEYFHTTQSLFLVAVGEASLWATTNYFFFYLIVPVCIFRKGRQTFGRKIFGLGYLTRKAVSPSRGNFIGRSVVEFFLFVPLGIGAFLIPLIVSATMLFLSENRQDLPDYIFGHYLVDARQDDIYSDPSQYRHGRQLHERSLLEDKDFQIEQNHI